MKYVFALVLGLCFFACKSESNENAENEFEVFGSTEVDTADAISAGEMMNLFAGLNPGDTIDVKLKTTVTEVCQTKGCWMMAKLDDDTEARVTFKDYGFFVPLNAAESEAVIQGKAFLSVTDVDMLRHYAEDAGKDAAEINLITEDEVGYGLIADAVMLK